MRIVVALGGNALLRRGEAQTAENQARNVGAATRALAPLCAAGHQIVLTHGNGPQVGLLAIQSASTPDTPTALDVLDAESAGMIGYLLSQGLRNALHDGQEIATLLTQVRVDPDDPAFQAPTKPIGQVYGEAEAHALARARRWRIARDGTGWRRVVASPEPLEILELAVIKMLIQRGVICICLGGGGIPVIRHENGEFSGIEAVIDKDLASALLATKLNADWLLMLTDVDAVYADWGTDHAKPIARMTPAALAEMSFAAGSMGPKIEAARSFVKSSRRKAGIGRVEDVCAILEGAAATIVSN